MDILFIALFDAAILVLIGAIIWFIIKRVIHWQRTRPKRLRRAPSVKGRCSFIGWTLIVIGLVLSTIGNRQEIHNKKLIDDVQYNQDSMDTINRKARRASTSEEALNIYAEERFNTYGGNHLKAAIKFQQESHHGSSIYALYLFGRSSFFLGVVLLIVALILPTTKTVSSETQEQAIDRRVVELEAEKRLQERERIRQEEERKRDEENKRLRRQRDEEEKQRQIQEEIDQLKTKRENKEHSIPLFQEALEHFSSRHFDKALTCCNKSIALFPHANSFLLRAWIHEALEKDGKVVKDCTEALRLNSGLYDARFIRGKAFMRRIEKAVFVFYHKWRERAVEDFWSIPKTNEHYEESCECLKTINSDDYKSSCFYQTVFSYFLLGTCGVFLSISSFVCMAFLFDCLMGIFR